MAASAIENPATNAKAMGLSAANLSVSRLAKTRAGTHAKKNIAAKPKYMK